MTRTGSLLRRRWPALTAAAVVLAVAVAAGSMFAANSGEQPIQEAAAAQVQPDLTDPGLYAAPRIAAPVAGPQEPKPIIVPPASALEPPATGQDPGINQVVPEGSSTLSEWLSDRPDEMGPLTVQDAMALDDASVSWVLYQAVYKDLMTQDEADAFYEWFQLRPTSQEAPELLDYQPPELERLN